MKTNLLVAVSLLALVFSFQAVADECKAGQTQKRDVTLYVKNLTSHPARPINLYFFGGDDGKCSPHVQQLQAASGEQKFTAKCKASCWAGTWSLSINTQDKFYESAANVWDNMHIVVCRNGEIRYDQAYCPDA